MFLIESGYGILSIILVFIGMLLCPSDLKITAEQMLDSQYLEILVNPEETLSNVLILIGVIQAIIAYNI